MQKVWKAIWEWVKANAPVLLYFVCAVVFELTAVFAVEGRPFISRPFLFLGLVLLFSGALLLIKNAKARVIVAVVLLAVQIICDLVFAVVFEMTDQYFDFGMLNLRNDALAILDSLTVNFFIFYAGLALVIFLIVFGLRYAHNKPYKKEGKKSVFFYIGVVLAGIATIGISFVSYYPRTAKDKYDDMVSGKANSAYSSYGMIGNLVGEFGNALFQQQTTLTDADVERFIYDKVAATPEYFGISKDKNVVVVLAESLEWYLFLRGDEYSSAMEGEYPNALGVPQEVLKELYPNLTAFYEDSVVMTSFHGREKTDIAETLSIMGSYPTGAYVNYDYYENAMPQTLPNILNAATNGTMSIRSYHNGFKTFYNRGEAHKSFGFEEMTDMYDMEEMSKSLTPEGEKPLFYNYMADGERNLDSEMIAVAKDEMFPTDKRFFTYITSITMHGMYYDRDNMQPETNTKLADKLALIENYKPTEETDPDFAVNSALYYYMITGLEFDYMLGAMKKDLQDKGLWENTVVAVFGDHNTYYQGLSGYVKEIDGYNTKNKYSDLYNIPFFIHDSDLTAKRKEEGKSLKVDKFTCTADIVPTLLGLLGIKYYDNMYYGNSVFAENTSVLYSRAYDVFIGDGILRRSVLNELYRFEGLTETGVPVADAVQSFESEGKRLVDKIEYCDYIFKKDYFGKKEHYDDFQTKMKALNSWN